MQQQSGWMRHLRWVTSATSFFVITVLFSFTYHDLLWASDMSKKYKYIIYKYICSNLISWTQMRTHVSTQTVFFQLFPQRFQQMFTPSWTHLKVVICNMTPGTMHPSVAFRKKHFIVVYCKGIFFLKTSHVTAKQVKAVFLALECWINPQITALFLWAQVHHLRYCQKQTSYRQS